MPIVPLGGSVAAEHPLASLLCGHRHSFALQVGCTVSKMRSNMPNELYSCTFEVSCQNYAGAHDANTSWVILQWHTEGEGGGEAEVKKGLEALEAGRIRMSSSAVMHAD